LTGFDSSLLDWQSYYTDSVLPMYQIPQKSFPLKIGSYFMNATILSFASVFIALYNNLPNIIYRYPHLQSGSISIWDSLFLNGQ